MNLTMMESNSWNMIGLRLIRMWLKIFQTIYRNQ